MSDQPHGLAGRHVLVTGATSGVGAALAAQLGRCQAHVSVVGRDAERLASTVEAVQTAGGRGVALAGDLADPDTAARLVSDCVQAFGPLDGLVLNASVFIPQPLAEVTPTDLERQWQVNVVSHLLLVQAALAHLSESSAIVAVSSTTAHAGFPGCSAYAATKGAIEAFARTLAVELAPRTRVTIVAPGFVRTPMLTPHLEATPGYETALCERTPVGRIGEPDEVAATIAFLLSPQAAYVVGATVVADGGWTIR